jgi:hypothetical protein
MSVKYRWMSRKRWRRLSIVSSIDVVAVHSQDSCSFSKFANSLRNHPYHI